MPLGTVISWLFALPGDGGANGFALTGGVRRAGLAIGILVPVQVLNYSAEVTFPNSRDKASILFVFKVNLKIHYYLKSILFRVWMCLTT